MKHFFLLAICLITTLLSHAQVRMGVECEDTCRHIHGIDLSHYQGTVFWETVGETKMAYVYLKASEGGSNIDSKYKQNIDLAHSYGLKVGSYHFYRPKIAQEVQLENFKAQCRPGDQDLIPMIDVETKSGLSTEAFRDSLSKFLVLVEKAYKQKPLVYTGTNFYNSYLTGLLDDYKLMIAQYSSQPPVLRDGKEYIMWQYTGKGHLNGINGYVDKSRFMGRHRLREIRFRHR
jgi:lysozyme